MHYTRCQNQAVQNRVLDEIEHTEPARHRHNRMLSVSTTFFDRCAGAMMQTLRENGLTREFMDYCPHPDGGYMYSSNPMITRLSSLVSDGHSGASFALCCRFVRERLLEKRAHRARFKGIVRAVVAFRQLHTKVLKRMYAPPTDVGGGGSGYAEAAEDFVDRITRQCAAPLPPPPPGSSTTLSVPPVP